MESSDFNNITSVLPEGETQHWHKPRWDFQSCLDWVRRTVCFLGSCGWLGRARCGGSPDRPTSCRDPWGWWWGWPLWTACSSHPPAVSPTAPGSSEGQPPSYQTCNNLEFQLCVSFIVMKLKFAWKINVLKNMVWLGGFVSDRDQSKVFHIYAYT